MRSGAGARAWSAVGRIAISVVLFVGCTAPPTQGRSGPSPDLSAKPAAPSAGKKAAARPELLSLGPDERRVALVVVPGDALVEVDGQPAHRRGGAIDLTGKLGDVRRVRVWKGAKTTEEKAVTIQEGKPSPAMIDLNQAPAVKAAGAGPKKPTRYGGFDD